MTVYRGDSPAKKIARLRFWERVKRELGPDFVKSKMLFLASYEGGDASVLTGLGAPAANLTAADREQAALDAFAERWPSVTRFHGDVAHAAASFQPRVAMLDFCGPYCPETVNVITGVLTAVKVGGILGVNLLRGREPVADSKKRKIPRCPCCGKTSISSRDYVSMFKSTCKNVGRTASAMARIQSVLFSVSAGVNARGMFLLPVAAWDYTSRTSDSSGSPMSMFLCKIVRQGYSPSQDAAVNVARAKRHGHTVFHGGAAFSVETVEADDDFVRSECLRLGDSGGPLLNVSARTVAAWRAHASRGTYVKNEETQQ